MGHAPEGATSQCRHFGSNAVKKIESVQLGKRATATGKTGDIPVDVDIDVVWRTRRVSSRTIAKG
jgi:hypothetical protein